jgi:hypothetical protein
MKALTLCAVSVLALSASACSHRNVPSAAMTGRLDCPETSGALKRISAAADGKSCDYGIADGAQVSLKLLPVGAKGAEALLAQLEANLRAETAITGTVNPVDTRRDDLAAKAVAEARTDSAQAWSTSDTAQDAVETSEVASKVDAKLKERGLGGDGDQTSAHVDMPGLHVNADDKTDSAHVSLPGVHIDAQGDGAAIRVGPLHIDTDTNRAVVKAVSDVRLRGEGFSRVQHGLQAMFVYAGDDLGGGYKYVGYEAAGPKTGPLTVAIVKSRKEGGFHGDVYGDVKRLVRRNGGI